MQRAFTANRFRRPGPFGRRSGSFDATSYGTLVAWYDAQDPATMVKTGGGTPSPTNTIQEWQNKEGTAAYDLDTDHSGGTGGTWTGSAITFNGTDQGIQATGANWGAETEAPLEVVCAVAVTDVDLDNKRIWGGAIGGANARLLKNSGNNLRMYSGALSFGAYAIGTNWHVLCGVVNGASSAIWVDGVEEETGAIDAACGLDGFHLAMSSGEAELTAMTLGDVMIYKPQLGAGARAAIVAALSAKYPIGLAA